MIEGNQSSVGQLTKELWAEFRTIFLLGIAVCFFLLVGQHAAAVAGGMRVLVDGYQGQHMRGKAVELVDALTIEPVQSQPYWEMRESDLTYNRITYNLTSKPGFRWMGFYLAVVLIGIAVMLHGGNMVFRLTISKTATGKEDKDRAKGTIHITAKNGIIYVSGLSPIIEGMRDYANVFNLAPMVIKCY